MVLAVALFTAAMAFTENAVNHQIGLARLEQTIARGWRRVGMACLTFCGYGATSFGRSCRGSGLEPPCAGSAARAWGSYPGGEQKKTNSFLLEAFHRLALSEGQKENKGKRKEGGI